MCRALCDSVPAVCRSWRVTLARSIGRRFTSTGVCCAAAPCAAPRMSSPMSEARISFMALLTSEDSLVVVLPFLVPGHLDGLELRLVRRFRVVVEPVELKDPLAQVRESYGKRVELGKLFIQCDADVLGVGPLHGCTSAGFFSSSRSPDLP